ncbi:TonB family protein [Marinibactrum halimedae]|uniref:TonB C-terminal domain-containing protein n=1 Tax=Marinibactrum halimedae TaxID=1444977 RepID=A0AA37WLY9_9GAMM|nr:TonB family protein [Marinibactrum halimedae]MCD9459588.1 TonB family protein [Marinibactrum halimedae]GLS25595.1 hypothetical protein GCM10007877_13090 [Marinibactrum halimedae]
MSIRYLASLFFIITVFTISHSAANNLVLNGGYTLQQLNEPLYTAALYVDKKSDDVNYILESSTHKKIVLVVAKKNWKRRAWTRYWKELLTINNTREIDQQSASALSQFFNLAKESLHEGDVVSLTYTPQLTTLQLNEDTVYTGTKSNFFYYVVKGWLGDVPPSKAFKNSLLNGEQDSDWLTTKNILSSNRIAQGRENIYSVWQKAEQQSKRESERKLKEVKRRQQERLAQEKALKEERQQQLAIQKKRQAEQKRLAETEKTQQKAIRQDNEEHKAATLIYMRKLVQWQVQRYVNHHTEFPFWAKNLPEKGQVDAQVILEKSEGFTAIPQTGKEDIFFQELKKTIHESIDHIWIPKDIDINDLFFDIQFLFSKNNKPQPTLIRPSAPEKIIIDPAGETEQARLLGIYQEDLKSLVIEQIKYPPQAAMMRERGKVSVEFTVNKWGEVIKVDFVKSARKPYFNSAIEKAIENAAPFKMLPLQVNTDNISIQLQYQFKS